MRKIIILACFLGAFSSLCAHSLRIFAKEQGDQIIIKSYFYGGSPCKNCDALIKSEHEQISAKTDENGALSLLKPKGGELEISINAGQGHFKSIKLSLEQNQASKSDKISALAQQNRAAPQASKESANDGLSALTELFKGFISILVILGFFAILYFFKGRKQCSKAD